MGQLSLTPAVVFAGVVLAAFACSDTSRKTDSASGRPPNVILLLADDLGWGDLRVYDRSSVNPTPNIDRLARQGIRFTDAHSPSSVCTPTRYGILTGRYAWRTRLESRVLRYFDPPLIETGRLTLPEMLRRRGYATAAIGKWHLGLNVPAKDGSGFARMDGRHLPPDPDFTAPIQGGPLDLGFDSYFGAQLARVRAFVRDRHFIGKPVPDPARARFLVAGWDESQKGPIQLAEAEAVIERLLAGDPERPFFLYFAVQYPHRPYVPAAQIADVPVAGTSGAGPRGDLVVELDAVLGQLVKRLEVLGIARDTLIILTSDNGAEAGAETGADAGGAETGAEAGAEPGAEVAGGHDPTGGWRGEKGSPWEGGHRIPFIARWGDGTAAGSVIPPSSVSGQLIGLQDLMATVADLIGEPLPPDAAEDSESFLSALVPPEGKQGAPGRQGAEPIRRHIVHHSVRGRFAIRRGDWKLFLGRPPAPGGPAGRRAGARLYNLTEDPREVNDLFRDHPEVVAQLTALLDRDRQSGHSASRLEKGAGLVATAGGRR